MRSCAPAAVARGSDVAIPAGTLCDPTASCARATRRVCSFIDSLPASHPNGKKVTAMQYDLFSVDDHIIEPPNVWSDRLPAALREAGPHVIEDDGRQFWLFEGRRGATMGLNAVAGKDYSEYSMDPV